MLQRMSYDNHPIPDETAARKPYVRPVLKRQGTVTELTRTTFFNFIITDGPGNYS